MGHKVSDGKSVVVTSPVGGTVKDTPYVISNYFGFADADSDAGESVSLSIGQEEREVTLPAKVGGWAIGDPVYVVNATSALTETATANRFVGRVTRAVAAAGGVGWMLVAPQAFADPLVGA
jgi:hypothetical protein